LAGIRKKTDGDLAAVPAAIAAVLDAIGNGSNFVVCADVSRFFTRIPKTVVTAIVAKAVQDKEFMTLFSKAIAVELSNIAELRERADAFPIYDIGVAQGNSLSPLIGNILLYEFDQLMNSGDCRCIRYIDDIIILAPTKKAAAARFKKARKILASHGLSFGAEKTSNEPIEVSSSFEFLGIELNNGLIRPAARAQKKFLTSIEGVFSQGKKALLSYNNGGPVKKEDSLLAVLRRVDGISNGWGKHYRFCNDMTTLKTLDGRLSNAIRSYLGIYTEAISSMSDERKRGALGIDLLTQMQTKPFKWPKRAKTEFAVDDFALASAGASTDSAS
jgi:hypothetical protein